MSEDAEKRVTSKLHYIDTGKLSYNNNKIFYFEWVTVSLQVNLTLSHKTILKHTHTIKQAISL